MEANTKRFLIAAAVVAAGLLLSVAPFPILVSLGVMIFWVGVVVGIYAGTRWWIQRDFVEPARYVSEIRRVDYFRRVPKSQLQNWVCAALVSRGAVLLGDPISGRSRTLGYAWQNGKKTIAVVQPERQLKEEDLRRAYGLKNGVQAESAIIVSPFSNAPTSNYPGIQVLAGKDLLRFMKFLDSERPVNITEVVPQYCKCGSPQVQYVSCAGEPLLVCSRYPECREVKRPDMTKPPSSATPLPQKPTRPMTPTLLDPPQ